MRHLLLFQLLLALALLPACQSSSSSGGDDDTDTGTDSDTDTEVDTDTGSDPWYGLQWQDPPAEVGYPWEEALEYCENLTHDGHDDWRLPSISEHRALFRGCPQTEPGGDCPLNDNECTTSQCLDETCGCTCNEGPGPEGCYWDSSLSGPCTDYWSSTVVADRDNRSWLANYECANFPHTTWVHAYNVRCVRGTFGW